MSTKLPQMGTQHTSIAYGRDAGRMRSLVVLVGVLGFACSYVTREELQRELAALKNAHPAPAPAEQIAPGTVVAYAGEIALDPRAVPEGWLLCDGTVIDVASAPELARLLGSRYGGNGVSTFGLPNYQGYFLRGADPKNSVDTGDRTAANGQKDSDRGVGSRQGDAFRQHTHANGAARFLITRAEDSCPGAGCTVQNGNYDAREPGLFDKSIAEMTNGGGAEETRPKNVYVHWLIKK